MSLDKLNANIENVEKIIDKFNVLRDKKKKIEKEIEGLKKDFSKKKLSDEGYKRQLGLLLEGKVENEFISKKNEEIRKLLKKIEVYNSRIISLFNVKIESKSEEGHLFDPKEVHRYYQNLDKQKKEKIKEKYTLRKKNIYGQIANQLFKNVGSNLTKKYPELFRDLYKNLRISNLNLFSDTYISMILLSGVLAFVLVFILLIGFNGIKSFFSFIQYLFIAILSSVVVLVGMYYWPKIVIDGRRREIKNDLPFAIMHMAAIAGSGAPLTSTFDMLLKSGEYKALNGEIKKIMNYVNLFGYNLSTALKSVAETTPSKEFKSLLNGLRSTIETGGDLKIFLSDKAKDTFTNYKQDRKKYVETLSTYSDIYTAVLIAAPLLFVIVLVLISLVGNKLGGIDIHLIEKVGIYFVVPTFNVAFIIFINIVQPDM